MYNQVSADGFTDSYKVGMSQLHSLDVFGYSVQIVNSYSNFTPRKNAFMQFSDLSDGHIVAYGMRDTFQNVVAMWNETFFKVEKQGMLKKLKRRTFNHFGSVTEHKKFLSDMADLHDLGYLPIEVRSIDEGTRYPLGLPLFTVKATVDGYGWLVNFIETLTSGLIWPMTNTATKVEQFYLQAKHYGEISAPKEVLDMWLPICVHEFGMRGYRGPQDQIRTSSAHSLFFLGSDTQGVIDFFEDAYDADSDEEPIAVSVRASEHADISRMLSLFRHLAQDALSGLEDGFGVDAGMEFLGKIVSAKDVLKRTELYVLAYFVEKSTGIMSYVSDTEHYYRLLNVYAKELREAIENRKPREDGQPPIFVFRPDSSRRTPLTVICGYKFAGERSFGRSGRPDSSSIAADEYITCEGKYYLCDINEIGHYGWIEITKEEAEGSLISLWNTFGGEEVETESGMMKLINPSVGLIYGEAISQQHQKEIYERMIEMGFSAVNVLMGKGSYASLEGSTRDLFSMSYKQTFSEALIDGKRVELAQQKTPMGDVSKTSAKGLLCVSYNDTSFRGAGNPEFQLEQEVSEKREKEGCLTLLLKDGTFSKLQTLKHIKDTYASETYYHLEG